MLPAKRAKKETIAEVLQRALPNNEDGAYQETFDKVLQRVLPGNVDGSYCPTFGGKARINNFLAVLYNLGNSASLSNKKTLTPTESSKKHCYFLTASRVLFWHKGMDNKMPKKVFVRDLSTVVNSKVAVFHSASGTRGTVELTSSSATHKTDFTFILQFSQDIALEFRNIDCTNGEKEGKEK